MSADTLTEAERADSERALSWLKVAATDGGAVTLSPQESLALTKRLRIAESVPPAATVIEHATRTARVVSLVGSGFVPFASDEERQKLIAGELVAVEMGDGCIRRFSVRQPPYKVYGDVWLVGLEGVPGGYDLDRVRARRNRA